MMPMSIMCSLLLLRIEFKESACSAGDPGLIPGSGRSTGEGIGYPLQYSCLENPRDRGVWWATVHGLARSRTQLSDCHSSSSRAEKIILIQVGKCSGSQD